MIDLGKKHFYSETSRSFRGITVVHGVRLLFMDMTILSAYQPIQDSCRARQTRTGTFLISLSSLPSIVFSLIAVRTTIMIRSPSCM